MAVLSGVLANPAGLAQVNAEDLVLHDWYCIIRGHSNRWFYGDYSNNDKLFIPLSHCLMP